MAPVVAVAAVPGGKPGGDDRAIYAAGKLLHAGKQRIAPMERRHGLDDPGAGIGGHGAGKRQQRLAAHRAVGVEHDHMVEVPAPIGNEISDVAGFPVFVLQPPPVVDA